MRTIVTILVMILLVQTTKAQELIFETTTGEIVTKSKFIDPFRKKTYNNITEIARCLGTSSSSRKLYLRCKMAVTSIKMLWLFL